eukprot:4456711-Prymnesium_polylepis.1
MGNTVNGLIRFVHCPRSRTRHGTRSDRAYEIINDTSQYHIPYVSQPRARDPNPLQARDALVGVAQHLQPRGRLAHILAEAHPMHQLGARGQRAPAAAPLVVGVDLQRMRLRVEDVTVERHVGPVTEEEVQ